MARTFLTAAQVDELVAMYVGGKTMREVTEHFRGTAPRWRSICVAEPCRCAAAS